jgi:hypothetical protein
MDITCIGCGATPRDRDGLPYEDGVPWCNDCIAADATANPHLENVKRVRTSR